MINIIDKAENEYQGRDADQAPQQIIRPWDERDTQSGESSEEWNSAEEGWCALMPAITAWLGHPIVCPAYLDRERNEHNCHGEG
jgi:hypothetical protein